MFIADNEINVNLADLTQLQKQLMHDIQTTAQADDHGDSTPSQLMAAAEKCAEQSYRARTPAGPRGELAAVYRAIGRALSRPVEVSDTPAAAGWSVNGRYVSRTVGEFEICADMDGDWAVWRGRGPRSVCVWKGRVPEQKNEEGTLRLAQKTAERELADKLRATLAILEG